MVYAEWYHRVTLSTPVTRVMPCSCPTRDTCMRPGSKYNATFNAVLSPEGCPTMPQPTRPRIAFLAAGFIQWTGGLDFLRLCVGGIDSVLPGATWPVLVPDDTASERALAFAVATKRRLFSLAGVQPPMTPPVSRTTCAMPWPPPIARLTSRAIMARHGASAGPCATLMPRSCCHL